MNSKKVNGRIVRANNQTLLTVLKKRASKFTIKRNDWTFEDVVQETCCRLLSIRREQDLLKHRGLAKIILLNLLRDIGKSLENRSFHLAHDDLLRQGKEMSEQNDVEEICQQNEIKNKLWEEIFAACLTPSQRKAVEEFLNNPAARKTKSFYRACKILKQSLSLYALWLES